MVWSGISILLSVYADFLVGGKRNLFLLLFFA